MTKITINHKNHTIEMSKSAYKAATRFGSEVYEEVQKARAAYPTYKVVEKSVSSKKASEYAVPHTLNLITLFLRFIAENLYFPYKI